jgi:hypothetical protein
MQLPKNKDTIVDERNICLPLLVFIQQIFLTFIHLILYLFFVFVFFIGSF